MATWDDLREVLARLGAQQPGPLRRSPSLRQEPAPAPPYRIALAPWAESIARDLNEQFGDDVELTVGQLPYPPGRRPVKRRMPPPTDVAILSPDEVTAALDGPATVRSGHTLRHGLLLTSHAGTELQVATNGNVTAVVVDPSTGQVVGGFSGAQVLPLIIFTLAPERACRIPLVIGTASFTPDLGYAVPPGDWAIQVPLNIGLDLGHAREVRTPPLPLTITA